MGEVPKALRERPELTRDLLYYKRLFMELSDSRSYTESGAPLPIPTSELLAYCEFFGVKELSEREAFYRSIRALDRAYVQVTSEQIKEQLKKPATDSKSPPAVAP